MGSVAATGQERWMRALTGLAMLVGLAVLLAACAGSNQPFSKSNGSLLSPSGKTPPPISITAMNGVPGDQAEMLFQSLAASAGKRDIAIVRGHFEGNFVMAGDFQAMPGPAGVIVAYRWVLADSNGQVIHTIQAQETGRPVAGDPWQGADPDLLRRIAAFTAENLSSRLSQLGYATQAAGLPPPANALARAGPDAENDIDLETLYGPDAAVITAAMDPAPEVGPEAGPQVRPVVAEAPPPAERADKPAAAEIRAVAVTRVNGSPGTGNGELVAAMRETLKAAGWPVLKAARADALTVRGEVDLSAPGDRTQTVALKWIVAMPDGKVLGTVDQSNQVPAGSLDQGWGRTAEFAAQAAAQGIFDVVRKAQAL
jgi:hypothetical protein